MSTHAPDKSVSSERREIVVAGLTAPIWLPGLVRSVMAEPSTPTKPDTVKHGVEMTIVYDNNPGADGLKPEWGFGCVITGMEKTILFDTGGVGATLLSNMRKLAIDLNSIDAVVLSHIHWDHVNGLASVASARKGLPVYMPSGFPAEFIDQARSSGTQPIEAGEPREICPGVRTTGTLGQGAIPEHGLCVKADEGWVMVTGCAHPGVDDMAARAKELTGGPMQFVFGGFHMIGHSEAQANAVIDRLDGLGVAKMAPCHCTGDVARAVFKKRLADRCELPHVGSVFRFRPTDKTG